MPLFGSCLTWPPGSDAQLLPAMQFSFSARLTAAWPEAECQMALRKNTPCHVLLRFPARAFTVLSAAVGRRPSPHLRRPVSPREITASDEGAGRCVRPYMCVCRRDCRTPHRLTAVCPSPVSDRAARGAVRVRRAARAHPGEVDRPLVRRRRGHALPPTAAAPTGLGLLRPQVTGRQYRSGVTAQGWLTR